VVITTTSLPAGRVSVTYSATVVASGGGGQFSWSLASGVLPAGLTLNGATGVISGTPSGAGTATFSLTAADLADPANKSTATFSVVTASGVTITSAGTLPSAKLKSPYAFTLQANYAQGATRWTKTGGSLPGGVTLSQDGVLSGTPKSAGTWKCAITVKDSKSLDTVTFTLVVVK
jgi:hypothetical protein